NKAFRDRWIGRGGAVLWPPRSPDMNPCKNIYLFILLFSAFYQTAVYREPVQSREEVVARIHGAVATISRDMLRRVQANIRRRAEACLRCEVGTLSPSSQHWGSTAATIGPFRSYKFFNVRTRNCS
ncbi:hypothetical protein WH47_10762, partial [Habropoda laboriosa]